MAPFLCFISMLSFWKVVWISDVAADLGYMGNGMQGYLVFALIVFGELCALGATFYSI